MFSSMSYPPPAPPPGMPHTLYSPFPPGHPQHPGAPPGHIIVHPSRPQPAAERSSPEGEEERESTDKLLKQILLGISKIASATKRNDQALRDITGRQSTIEDRLSLMDQRVARITSRLDELIDSNKTLEDDIKRSGAILAHTESLTGDVKTVSAGFASLSAEVADVKAALGPGIQKVDGTTATLLTHVAGMVEYTQELGKMAALQSDVAEVKALVTNLPATAAAAPPAGASPPVEEEAAPAPAEDAPIEDVVVVEEEVAAAAAPAEG